MKTPRRGGGARITVIFCFLLKIDQRSKASENKFQFLLCENTFLEVISPDVFNMLFF